MKMLKILGLTALVFIAGFPAKAQQYPATATNTNSKVNPTTPVSAICTGGVPCPAGTSGDPIFVSGGGGGSSVVTQPTASLLNATVVGTGTLATQSAQSGTWTVQPGNTANTVAWKVDGSAVTQPVTNSGTFATQISASIPAGSNQIGFISGQLGFVENTTAMTSNQTINGTARGIITWATRYNCRAYGDQAGTVQVQESDDGTATWQPASAAVAYTALGPAQTATAIITGATGTTVYRCVNVNGAIAQTVSRFTSSFTAN